MQMNVHASGDLYGLKVKNIDGAEVAMASFKGKVLLIVNTASQCGYTSQYDGLEALYDKYKARGLVVMGFPSNDFGGQEPGTDGEIKRFCQTRFKVEFPMFAKGAVKGPGKQPVYEALLRGSGEKGEVKWNFEKFLVSREGSVVGRFESKVTPEDPGLIKAIETQLSK